MWLWELVGLTAAGGGRDPLLRISLAFCRQKFIKGFQQPSFIKLWGEFCGFFYSFFRDFFLAGLLAILFLEERENTAKWSLGSWSFSIKVNGIFVSLEEVEPEAEIASFELTTTTGSEHYLKENWNECEGQVDRLRSNPFPLVFLFLVLQHVLLFLLLHCLSSLEP